MSGGGGFGGGGFGSEPVEPVDVTASLAADSSVSASVTNKLQITSTMAGAAAATAVAGLNVNATLAGAASVSENPTLSLGGNATAAGVASETASGTVEYAAQGFASAESALSGAPMFNVTMTAFGVANASVIPTAVATASADGEASVTSNATVVRGVDSAMAGAADLELDYGRVTASLDGDATVTADPATLVYGSIVMDGIATAVQTPKLILGAQLAAAGDSNVQADPTPETVADMSGAASMVVSQPSVLVNASAAGAAAIVANPTVNSTSVVTMAGAATLSATPNLLTVQITATMQGGSDLHADQLTLGEWGSDGYGNSPYGGAHPPYGILSAEALTPTLVRVRYTAMFDGSFAPLFSPFNYSISPPIAVHSISLESAQSVLLVTDPLAEVAYTVTITEARGYFGQPLDPYRRSASFVGVPSTPTFYAVATRNTRVRVVFTDVMLQNSALTDPGQYLLTDMTGASVTINSVAAEQSTDVRSVVLTLGEELVDERHYQVTTLSGVVTATLLPLNPNTSVFQWVENPLRTQIPLELFSGEVQNGLYGIHGGLVFFSPALQNSAPNSIIQVEEVDVCTRAYDEYHFPEPLDPPVFFTHGGGLVSAPESLLNSTASLWAEFPRLSDARFVIESRLADELLPPVDAICDITLSETWDLSRVSLLNITDWMIWAPPDSGTTSIAPAAPGFFTLSGLSGMSVLDVGSFLIISGAGYEGHNGTFRITAFISATSVEISNPFGVGTDSANWARPDPFIVADALTPIPPGNTTKMTYLQFNMHGQSQVIAPANVLLAAQTTMAGSSTAPSEGTIL